MTARNRRQFEEPDLINTDPYRTGSLIEMLLEDPTALDQMLDAATYQASLDT